VADLGHGCEWYPRRHVRADGAVAIELEELPRPGRNAGGARSSVVSLLVLFGDHPYGQLHTVQPAALYLRKLQ
jgi:hypothetical protein